MTSQEAIDLLDNLIGMVEDNQESDYDEALKMAVTALKSDGDTISRRAAIDALHDEIVRRRISEDSNDDGALDEFDTEAILRRLPSAQRKGKWIAERYMDEVDSCFYTRYKCSECGRIVYDSSLPYCHCGAEMKGEENADNSQI